MRGGVSMAGDPENRLGDAMTAHAITNFLLGVWVVWRHAWNFW